MRPINGILQALNGQGCASDAEPCENIPSTGDLVGLGLAFQAGNLAMQVSMQATSSQKLSGLALSIGAIGGAFAQSFFLETIVAALSEGGGIDAATMALFAGGGNSSSGNTSSSTNSSSSGVLDVDLGGVSVASDPAQLVNYIKLGITGACAAVMLFFAAVLQSVIMILAGAAFGSLIFAGAVSGVVGGGMVRACDGHGYIID